MPVVNLFPRKVRGTAAAVQAVAVSFGRVEPSVSVWPAWADELRKQKAAGETGVGDTAERLIGPIGGDVFKRLVKNCGCGQRKEDLNRLYPY